MKRATLILVISILMLTTLVMPGITIASGTPPVDYTWTLVALGQGPGSAAHCILTARRAVAERSP